MIAYYNALCIVSIHLLTFFTVHDDKIIASVVDAGWMMQWTVRPPPQTTHTKEVKINSGYPV